VAAIEEIKDRVDTVAFCEKRWKVSFRQAGKGRMKACCPMHGEKTPSFVVYPDGGWFCFGACNRGGDVISLVELIDGMSFEEALAEVASAAGLDLTPVSEKDRAAMRTAHARMDTLEVITTLLHERLLLTDKARAYCTWRGWTDETVKTCRLGYVDGSLRKALGTMNVDLGQPVVKAALQIKLGMLVYPHIERGRVVYLSGRMASDKEKGHYNPPADLMGPRRVFWNRVRGDEVVLVEGQADAITLGQWEIPAMAWCGVGAAGASAAGVYYRLRRFKVRYIWPDDDGKTDLDGAASVLGPMTRIIDPDAFSDAISSASPG